MILLFLQIARKTKSRNTIEFSDSEESDESFHKRTKRQASKQKDKPRKKVLKMRFILIIQFSEVMVYSVRLKYTVIVTVKRKVRT